MSKCSKCGNALSDERYVECADEDTQFSEGACYQSCIERQLSSLRSLLRSVTLKLEEAHDMINGVPGSDAEHSKVLIASVLEALS